MFIYKCNLNWSEVAHDTHLFIHIYVYMYNHIYIYANKQIPVKAIVRIAHP